MGINYHFSLDASWIVTFILIGGAIAFHIIYKVIVKKHRADPEYVRKQQEREVAYLKKMQEENDRLTEEYLAEGDEYPGEPYEEE